MVRAPWTLLRSRVAIGTLALVVGFGVAAAPRLLDGGDDVRATNATRGNPRAIATAPAAVTAATSQMPLGTPTAPEAPEPAAATPAAAVDSFLRAEAARAYATSYGLLAAGDRATHRSRAGWMAAHAQLPVVRGFGLGAVRIVGDRAEVDGTVELQPELDTVVGLVPGTALATLVTLAEDGGWRVAFAESTLTPQYASADTAPAAARTWVAERAGCADQARAALLGVGTLADQVCAARGPVRVGAPVALQPGEPSDPFLAAYGPDAFTWARVVPVTAPARVGVVLAPVGPRWRVIGLVDLSSLPTNPPEGASL